MIKKITLPLLLLFSLSLLGQKTKISPPGKDWIPMMKDGRTNIHDVQKTFYSWYTKHKNEIKLEALKTGRKEEDCAYTLFRRWEWLVEPRTYPTGNYPDPSILSSAYKRMLEGTQTNRTLNTTSTANWTYQGNDSVPWYGGDGRINHLRFYPGNSNIMFACSPTGGLWKSTNGGTTWNTNTDQLAELGTSDIAIDPSNPNVMYLATGDCDGPGCGFSSISTIGILKTTDGGATWNPTGLSYTQASTGPGYGTITELAINPGNTNIVLAATSNGMYYSSNGGTTWTQEDTEYFRSVELEPFHPSVVFASTNTGKFFRSTNGGISYTQITAGLPSPGVAGRSTVAVSPADSNKVYVIFEDATTWGYYGLYRSTDRGQTFTKQSDTNSSFVGIGFGWYGLPIAVSPTNADSVIAGGIDVYLSPDGGVTWNKIGASDGNGAPYVHADGHHYIFLPGSGSVWFDACDGGIYKTNNLDTGYTNISNNLRIAEIYAIGPSSITPGLSLTGWQDNGTNMSGTPWQEVYGGDGMVPFIDYVGDDTMYCTTQDGILFQSTDHGLTWNYLNSTITENGPWVTRWMQDPKNMNVLFAGFSNVWMSKDEGFSWNPISKFSSSSADISALIVDPSNEKVLYAAWHDSIFNTYDQGFTPWKNITATLPVSKAWITGIALDPANYKHAWVTFSGYVDSIKVYQTYDGGTTWTNLSSGLPNLPVNCILFQQSSNEGIYVGTDCGIYYRDTLNKNWIPYNTGLPNVMVNDIKYDASGNLVAATYGRGVWTSPRYVTGINNISNSNANAVKIYPDPSTGKFTIEFNTAPTGSFDIKVYNELGEAVYTSLKNNNTKQYTIDLSDKATGLYFVKVYNDNFSVVKKVMVER